MANDYLSQYTLQYNPDTGETEYRLTGSPEVASSLLETEVDRLMSTPGPVDMPAPQQLVYTNPRTGQPVVRSAPFGLEARGFEGQPVVSGNVLAATVPDISGGNMGVNWAQLAGQVAPGLLGAVGAVTGSPGTGGKIAGGTVIGRTHGLLMVRTTTGRTAYIKVAKRRRYPRRGGGGFGSFRKMMLELAMLKHLK